MIDFKINNIIFILMILILLYFMSNSEYFQLTSETEQILNKTLDEQSLLCNDAYNYYNLYNSKNNFTVKGNDINWNYKNIIKDYDTLYDLGSTNYPVLNKIIPNYNPSNTEITDTAINKLFESSPKKIGCCFRNRNDETKKSVLVRVPLSPNDTNIDPTFKEFDFKLKSLDIPAESCPAEYYSGSNECNSFFDLYCQNLITDFQNQKFKPEDFYKYAPECACYAPRTEVQQIYPDTTPPACYKKNCDKIDNPIAYVDPISRENPCNITVCQNIFNATVKAGGNVTINPKLENTCGKFADPNTRSTDTIGINGQTTTTSTSGTGPVSGGTTPVSGGTTPVSGGTTPATLGGTTPATLGGTTPATLGGTTPATLGGTTPATSGGTTPATSGTTTPATSGGTTTPAASGGTTPAASGGTTSATSGTTPATSGTTTPATSGGTTTPAASGGITTPFVTSSSKSPIDTQTTISSEDKSKSKNNNTVIIIAVVVVIIIIFFSLFNYFKKK